MISWSESPAGRVRHKHFRSLVLKHETSSCIDTHIYTYTNIYIFILFLRNIAYIIYHYYIFIYLFFTTVIVHL